MLTKIIESYIRKSKNTKFKFDKNVDSYLLFSLLISKFISFLRSLKFYKFQNRSFSLFFGKHVSLFEGRKIYFGKNVNIGDYVKLNALGKEGISIGSSVNIGSFSQIIVSTTFDNIGKGIKIHDNVAIGEFAYIGGAGGVIIGSDTIVGQYLSIHPENHIFKNPKKLIRNQGVSRKGVIVGNNCWIGSKVTILDGITIGNNCVLAAGSVITKSFPDNSLIAGVPAKLIRKIN